MNEKEKKEFIECVKELIKLKKKCYKHGVIGISMWTNEIQMNDVRELTENVIEQIRDSNEYKKLTSAKIEGITFFSLE